MPARLERGAARLGPADGVALLDVALVRVAAGFALLSADLVRIAVGFALLAADLERVAAGFALAMILANDFDLTSGLALDLRAGFRPAGAVLAALVAMVDFGFAAPVRLAGPVFAAPPLVAGFDFTARALLVGLLADLLAGLVFAALLRAAVFLAGAFSGVVLFPEAELHESAGHIIMGDNGVPS